MNTTNPQRFEDRLLDQLRQVVADRETPVRPEPKRRHRQLVLAGVGGSAAVAAVVLAAIAIFLGSGRTTPNAYAVESRPDGIVLVSIDSPRDVNALNTFNPGDAAGLQAGLEEAGVPAVVDFGPADQPVCDGPQAGEVAGEGATAYGPLGWDGLNEFWAELRREGGVAWGELPPLPEFNAEGEELADSLGERPLRDTPGLVGRDGHGVFIMVNPSRIEPGERLFITAPDGTVEGITMSVSSQAPTVRCAESEAP